MDNNASPQLESGETSLEVKPESQASRKRKMIQKRVVSVRIGENVSKVKNEGLPSDVWSWRKYGQKPIKGSPYPRGYYRCSTSKGCSAKKQVERSSTDSSMLIITYTSTHNHPDPAAVSATSSAQQPKESETKTIQDLPVISNEEDLLEHAEQEMNHTNSIVTNDKVTNEENFHYLQTPMEDPFKLNMEKHHMDLVLEEKPLCYATQLKSLSESKLEELDYFDELEELPMSSSVFQFTRSIFSDERIPVAPS
ncbi:probable WRKY transcription factor 35 [Vicia villosa]|uniref:probable WRKY transcription factor 35 n=1 Tax=Vicia villosa TaxID=3911 RepID=UPI00273CCB20|nr:probable WRKY transcription factor 35 [Vicia villosa]